MSWCGWLWRGMDVGECTYPLDPGANWVYGPARRALPDDGNALRHTRKEAEP